MSLKICTLNPQSRYVIYKTTNLINGMIYVGKDCANNPNYLGSGKLLKLAIKKYGIENFKKEILEYCENREELSLREIFWIEELKVRDPLTGYNIALGGEEWNFDFETLSRMKKEQYAKMTKEEIQAKMKKIDDTLGKVGIHNRAVKIAYARWNNPIYRENTMLRFGDMGSKGAKSFWENADPVSRMKRLDNLTNSAAGKSNVILRICPKCGKEGKGNAMQRWHFDNCKIKN